MITRNIKSKQLHLAVGKTVLLGFIITALFLIQAPPAWGEAGEENEATASDVTIFHYGDEETDDRSFKLTGSQASQEGEVLVIRDFLLIVRKAEAEENQLLYEISGKKIKLEESKDRLTALTSDSTDIKIRDRLKGKVGHLSYDFSSGTIAGAEVELVTTRFRDVVTMTGSSMHYSEETGEIKLKKGFVAKITESEETTTRLSGRELTWYPDGKVDLSGKVRARIASGWDIKANRITWRPEKASLKTGDSARAVSTESRIRGRIKYNRESGKITVSKGTIILKDDVKS